MPDITLEDDTPRKVVNKYTEPIAQLIGFLEKGTPKRWAIPVADEEERAKVLRMCRDTANAQGYSAGERQLDDDDQRDPSKVLLIGVREKRERKPAATAGASA